VRHTEGPSSLNAERSLRGTRARIGAGAYSDVILAFGVVAIVALMILPLPTALMDALLAVSISIGVGLLLIAIYIPSAVAFSSFPSVLLISTLFRLSLAVATTRLILLDADAGHIVETFGKLVAGGNLIVGLVVFLIITVVQFIVIAKGAERVAEVAARFTLDAMPGKQLSIDSDLRSGLIDKDDAKRRRRLLETESQLHGALDGAMKFVKGDAIAGIVIIIVNLLGGLAVGVLQKGMAVGDALVTYSILTIGDGLVMQIPALLAAISAGLVVTRTAGDEQDRHLGEAISRQIVAQPRVLLITGIIALFLAMVPGFPSLIFTAVGALLLMASGALSPQGIARFRSKLRGEPMQAVVPVANVTGEPEFPTLAPLIVEISAADRTQLELPQLEREFARLRESLYQDLGVIFPAAQVRFVEDLPAQHFRARLFEVPTVATQWKAGFRGLDPAQFIALHLAQILRRQAAQFLGIQEVNTLIGKMSAEYPDLVKELLRVIPLQRLSDILKRLVDESVSIRNLRDIFESLAEAGQREKDVVLLAEYARIGLKRYLSSRHAGADRALLAMLLHPELEDKIRQSIRVSSGGAHLALDPDLAGRILANLRNQRSGTGAEGTRPTALLTSLDVRRHVRKLIEAEFFELPVLSYHELAPEIAVKPVAQLNA
jgi:type III secretion protein V